MSFRRALGLALFVVLSACEGSCSCGSSSDDDGNGGSGAATSSVTGTTTTSTSSPTTGTAGEGGAGVTSTGGAGQGGDTTSAGGTGEGGTGQGGTGQGGTGQGGTGQGGTGQGGTGQGGAGGEASGGSGGGGPIAARECDVAEDCQLVEDCCTCDAIPASETPEECLAICVQSVCSAQQRSDDAVVSCVAGRCVAGFDCNWNLTTCDAAPPTCDEGFTASVIDGCYGPCVRSTECNSVGSCEQCDGGLGCVEQVAFGSAFHCVTDAPCAVDDCSCLGPSVCDDGAEICIEDDDDDVVVCECIVC